MEGLDGDVADGKRGFFAGLDKAAGLVDGRQSLVKLGLDRGRAVSGSECGGDSEIWFGSEVFYLVLALYNQAHGDRLDASGRQGGLDFLPEHGRQLEADDAVEHTARLLGVDAVDVDRARIGDGVEYGALGNLVEDYAARVLGLQTEHLIEVPGDGLSLAVLIGCEPDGLGFGGVFLEFGHELSLVVGYFVDGREAVVNVYAELFLL